jgi:amino acid adenylation domain-containing protein
MFLKQTIHEVFAAVAARTPDRVALHSDDRQVSYAELARRSDRIAQLLRDRGVTPGRHIGLYAQRSVDAIVAMLGILKAGAAYVPFDPSYPAKLLQFVYQDCAPSLMLVQRSLVAMKGEPPFWDGTAIDIDALAADAGERAATQFDATRSGAAQPERTLSEYAASLPAVGRDDLAYIMYTSGSTGYPKGVLVPHRGVVRLVIDNPFATMGEDQVHLQLAPLAFDASTFEIWGALLNGGRLAILPAPYPSLDEIAEAIQRYGVTTLWLTAGLFHLMVDHRLDGLKPLTQLIAGGDVLSPPHVAKALSGLPQCQLINGYGPTENTTFTCCYRIPRGAAAAGPVPIGKPIAHTQVYVLDDSRAPVAHGQDGELFAGGDGVALGYLNRPELTAERFTRNPFDTEKSSLLYRTGDRVRRRSDGNLEFLGRADRQVKISGKRVELDEIEACLRRSALLEDAAVTSFEAAAGSRKIAAYVKPKSGKSLIINDLRDYLKQELADYMMPASIVILDALPLSPTGKVDRAKLPSPVPPNIQSPGGPLKPGSEMEAALLGIWRSALGTDAVGVDDNFFDLGGTSLQLIQVHATIRSVMKADITVVDLFQYPRISALAGCLAQRASAPLALAPQGTMLSAKDRARRQQSALARARPPQGRSAR